MERPFTPRLNESRPLYHRRAAPNLACSNPSSVDNISPRSFSALPARIEQVRARAAPRAPILQPTRPSVNSPSAQAVAAVLRLNPEILIIDISLPILNGLQAAKQLQAANCRAKIIFLTVHMGPEFIGAAFASGASGFVSKTRLSTDLIPAIQEVMLGHTFVSGSLPT
jgi:DNA-binding NarL/FixJ family response regulator